MIKKRIFKNKPALGSVEWQRMIIREEARESLKKEHKHGKSI
jgi:hypothetical protein